MLIDNRRKGNVSAFKKKMICGISIAFLGVMYLFGRNNYEPKPDNTILNTFFVKWDVAETKLTLESYNLYLEKIGSLERLTKKDLQFITDEVDEDYIIIRTSPSCYSMVKKSYMVYENSQESIELGTDDSERDLFSSSTLSAPALRNIIGTLGEFIEENDISPIGIKMSYPTWNDEQVAFILEHFNEDVLDCFHENGFPLFLYNVSDFYEAYERKQGVTR